MKIIGHRGARGLAPENTLASLSKSLEHKVDEIEIDVRVTKDNVPVLHHDKTLQVADGPKLEIKSHTLKELINFKKDLITLAEAIEYVDRKVPLYIEIKPSENTSSIAKIIKHYLLKGWSTSNFLIGSKKQKTLLAIHNLLPEIEKIVIEPWSGVRANRRAKQVGAKRLSMNRLWLWSGFIYSVSKGGKELYAYTLNDPKKAKKWQKYGLKGVVTDYPDLF